MEAAASRCPACGAFSAARRELAIAEPDRLRALLGESLDTRVLVLSGPDETSPGQVMELQLGLPGAWGTVQLLAEVLSAKEDRSVPEAPWEMELRLLDLTPEKQSLLDRASTPAARTPPPDSDMADLDNLDLTPHELGALAPAPAVPAAVPPPVMVPPVLVRSRSGASVPPPLPPPAATPPPPPPRPVSAPVAAPPPAARSLDMVAMEAVINELIAPWEPPADRTEKVLEVPPPEVPPLDAAPLDAAPLDVPSLPPPSAGAASSLQAMTRASPTTTGVRRLGLGLFGSIIRP